MANDIYGDFYNPTRLISTGKPMLFSIGVRSCGKSTGWLIHLLKEYMKYGKQFIYLRRTKDEVDVTAEHSFDNAVEIYNDYYRDSKDYKPIGDFVYKGGKYYINGAVAGYAMALSLQQKVKSVPLSKIFWVVYDEFLVSRAGGSFLGSTSNPFREWSALLSLFVSCDRSVGKSFRDEVRVICIGNNESYYSPIFIKLHMILM